MTEGGPVEKLYKVLVIGDIGVGKTSIIKRYVHNFFTSHYRATIGVDFALKVLQWDASTVVRLQLWDVAGQERYGSMTRVYYKEAVGVFVVFDVTRAQTFDSVRKWKEDLDSKVVLMDQKPVPAILLANKSDLPEREGIASNVDELNKVCSQMGFAGWFECSAKENMGIEDGARALVSEIMRREAQILRTFSNGGGAGPARIAGTGTTDENTIRLDAANQNGPTNAAGKKTGQEQQNQKRSCCGGS